MKVFADETRPLLQGARLTAYELSRAGIDVTLICDNMAGMVMKNGWVTGLYGGLRPGSRNGDVANKIGTSSVAVLAHYYHISLLRTRPYFPPSTWPAKPAARSRFEQRNPDEIRECFIRNPCTEESQLLQSRL